MHPISFYQQRLSELLNELQKQFDTITQDGVIDYNEAVYGKDYIATYQDQLHNLKGQVHDDIKATRDHYKLRLIEADTASRRILRDEETLQINAYQKVIHLIDRMLLDVEGSKRIFMDTLGEFKMEELTQQNEAVEIDDSSITEMDTKEFSREAVPDFEPEEAETQEFQVVKLTVTRDELLLLMDKWQQLAIGMEMKHNRKSTTPDQKAQFVGAKKAFDIVIEDIQNLLTTSEEHTEIEKN